MKRKFFSVFIACTCAIALLGGCSNSKDTTAEQTETNDNTEITDTVQTEKEKTDYSYLLEEAVTIKLSDNMITVDGETVSSDTAAAVYTANDIVFYQEGQDFTYGEGTEADEHSQEEADAHTVVHITEAGTYRLTGSLSAGQVAIDLGEDAEEDPNAVVNLILDNVDITCNVAPAVIFYNVYECGSTDTETATKDVDTSAAGANVFIAEGSENNINGSYVARIYKSVELNDEGTEVVDSKKLHKYDGAFYSKMSMNVNAIYEGTGVLNITAENEGLDSELHLTINGGNINIESGNDGINTNEDEVSVTTINDGVLNINVTGTTGEGDGIDSNGWLVINGGSVTAAACSTSGDAGIDSDMGIYINGGTVAATGNMLDQIAGSEQTYVVFQFSGTQKGGNTYTLKSEDEVVAECTPINDFTYFILSSPGLKEGTYTFWCGSKQLSGSASSYGMGGGMMKPDRANGEMPEDMEMPEGMEIPEGGQMPEGRQMPADGEMPEGMEMPEGEVPEGIEMPTDGEMPAGGQGFGGGHGGMGGQTSGESSTDFVIVSGSNYFINVAEVTA